METLLQMTPQPGELWFDTATAGELLMWDGGSWIQLTGVVGTPASGGGGAVDLSAYVTTTAMNTAIQNFIEVGDITVQTGAASGGGSLSYNNGQFTFNPAVTTDLTGYATETYVDDSIATLTGGVTIPSDINDLTDADGLLNTDINELSDVDGLLNTDINELSDADGLLNTDINELSDADGLLNSGGSSIAAAPKQIAAGLTTGLTSIANIENGEVLVTWIAGYQQNNNSETMTVYDSKTVMVGANPTSTVLATGTNTVKWVNNTGSTVSVHIYATATSTGSSVRVVAMHFGADASTQAAGQIVGGTFTTPTCQQEPQQFLLVLILPENRYLSKKHAKLILQYILQIRVVKLMLFMDRLVIQKLGIGKQ